MVSTLLKKQKTRLIIFFGALYLLGAFPSKASEHTIFWGEMHIPPLSYLEGPDKGTGVLNLQLDMILNALPAYHQAKIPVSIRRLLEEMVSGRKFCFQALTKTEEREAYIDFSAATMITFPNGLITTQKAQQKLSPYLTVDGSIDLSAMLNDPNITMADFEARTYSENIDKILSPHRAQKSKSLKIKTGMPDWSLAVKQVLHNRLDAMIGRPGEVHFIAKQLNMSEQLLYIPIKNEAKYSLVYAGCSKGSWNESYLKDLNKAIIELRSKPNFIELRLEGIPASLHKKYLQYRASTLSGKFPE